MKDNKVAVTMYLDPDTFRALDDMRNPKVPRSVFCATIITEVLGIKTPENSKTARRSPARSSHQTSNLAELEPTNSKAKLGVGKNDTFTI